MITVLDFAHSPQVPIPEATTLATASPSNPPPEVPASPIHLLCIYQHLFQDQAL